MRFLLLVLFALPAIAAPAPLNLSGRQLPQAMLDGSSRDRLDTIRSSADAARLLDAICIVLTPQYRTFLGDYDKREISINDSPARMYALLARDERQVKAARGRAERLTRALGQHGVPGVAGLASNDQVATTLRTIVALAVSPSSGVRVEAQAWIRSDARIQVALESLFAPARHSQQLEAALPAIDFLLNKQSERSEDAMRALSAFVNSLR